MVRFIKNSRPLVSSKFKVQSFMHCKPDNGMALIYKIRTVNNVWHTQKISELAERRELIIRSGSERGVW